MQRIRAVRSVVDPAVRFIVDPNSAWSARTVLECAEELAGLGAILLEQPVPPGDEDGLDAISGVIAVCADEAVTDSHSLEQLPPVYTAINIKLEKTGGLTDALRLAALARGRARAIMVGWRHGPCLARA